MLTGQLEVGREKGGFKEDSRALVLSSCKEHKEKLLDVSLLRVVWSWSWLELVIRANVIKRRAPG